MIHSIHKCKQYVQNVLTDPVLYCFAAGLMVLLMVELNLVVNL